MNARLFVPLIALSLAFAPGCSKKKEKKSRDSSGEVKKEKPIVLDAAPSIPNKLEAEFDGKVTLLGYKLDAKAPFKPGQKIKVTQYWQAKEKLAEGYALFTHVLDGSGERIANTESKGGLRAGKRGKPNLPPSEWDPKKVYVDEVTIKIPTSVTTDQVQISTGFYKGDVHIPVTKGEKDGSNRAIVATLPVALDGSAPKSKSARIPSVNLEKLEAPSKIKIDGKLDEAAWQSAPVLGPFVDVATGEANKTFPVNAKARLLWNDEGLYVGFDVEDKDVVGGFPKDKKDPYLWTKDAVELMIDPGPEGDNQDYYEIQIGPQNLVFDSAFDKYNDPRKEPEGPFGHEEWSANLKSAVVVSGTLDKSEDEDKGYTVEALIPWKSFSKAKKTPPALGDVWRMNVYAMQANAGVGWSAILGQGNFHKASRFGRVRFTEKGWLPTAAGSASAAPSGAPSGLRAPKTGSAELKAAPVHAPKPVGSAP
jgi:hypothetical protein